MDLAQLRAEFERMGADDPMWAVLTDPDKRGRRWDAEEFFATGEKDVREALARCSAAGIEVRRGTALDFGCGVGRLTRALATRFERVVGVDIAASMVDAARRLVPMPNVEFVVNTTADLTRFGDASFDFVFTHITLQHMEPRYSLAYIGEFARVLRDGGAAVFQVPVTADRPKLADRVKSAAPGVARVVHQLRTGGAPFIEMYAVPERQVERELASRGVTLVARHADPNAGRGARGMVFVGVKQAARGLA